jgi:hypothetical protein
MVDQTCLVTIQRLRELSGNDRTLASLCLVIEERTRLIVKQRLRELSGNNLTQA